jgi:hypothetical protein
MLYSILFDASRKRNPEPNAELEQRPTGNGPYIAQKRPLWAVCSKLWLACRDL